MNITVIVQKQVKRREFEKTKKTNLKDIMDLTQEDVDAVEAQRKLKLEQSRERWEKFDEDQAQRKLEREIRR